MNNDVTRDEREILVTRLNRTDTPTAKKNDGVWGWGENVHPRSPIQTTVEPRQIKLSELKLAVNSN